MITRTHNFLQWAFVVFVVYLVLSRVLITWVQFYPSSFVSLTSNLSGTQVEVGDIRVTQDWLGFQLELDDIQLNSETFLFQAETLSADFNSFFFLLPTVNLGDYLTLEKGVFQLTHAHVPKKNQDNEAGQGADEKGLFKLDANVKRLWKRVHLTDFVLTDIYPGLSIQLHEFNSLKDKRFNSVAEFSLSYDKALNHERFYYKSSFKPNIWGGLSQGDVSLKSFKPLRVERLAKLLPKRWHPVLPKGEVILNLHGEIANSFLQRMSMELHGQSLKWEQDIKSLPESAGVKVEWQRNDQQHAINTQDWSFSVSNIQIDNKYIQSVSPLNLRTIGASFLYFEAEKFDIAPFQVVLETVLRTEVFGEMFARAIDFNISNLKGKFDWKNLGFPELSFQIHDLQIPETNYPGLRLQNFSLEKTADTLTISTPNPVQITSSVINAHKVVMTLPSQFVLNYDRSNRSWRLPELLFHVDEMPFALSVNQLNRSYIDAKFELEVSSMTKLKGYLPYSVMSADLQSWLKRSLLGGNDIKFEGVVRGLFNSFPYTNGEGVLDLKAHVKDAKLNFHSKWPTLSRFDARLHFKPYELSIEIPKVEVGLDNYAQDVKVFIPNLNERDIAITLSGNVDSTLENTSNYLTTSPLADSIGIKTFLESRDNLQGKTKIQLDRVWVPVSGFDGVSEQVRGQVRFMDARLDVLEQLKFENINGVLNFSEKGVASKTITFNSLGGAGSLGIRTDEETRSIVIEGKGRALQIENAWFEKPIDWDSEVNIPFNSTRQEGITVSAMFDVFSADSTLPMPFAKSQLANKQLYLKAEVLDESTTLQISLDKLVNTDIRWQKEDAKLELKALHVYLGESQVKKLTAKPNETFISGSVKAFELTEWFGIYDEFMNFISSGAEKEALKWDISHVLIEKATLFGSDYSGLGVSWQSELGEPLAFHINNEDVSGKVTLQEENLILVDIDHVKITTSEDPTKRTEQQKIQQCDKPEISQSAPLIKIKSQNISIDERDIESLEFTLQQSPGFIVIKDIEGAFGSGTGAITGTYLFDTRQMLSQIDLLVKSKNIQEMSRFLGINDGFTGNKGEVKLDLTWYGGLECFSTLESRGQLKFDIKSGVIEDVEPGIARLIGLLSVESLVRRIKLDMKDLTNEGMAFDRIKGSVQLNDGLVDIHKMQLTAPSANGSLTGLIHLDTQTFDLDANITPKVGSTIPTIAAIAGNANPITALAVYTLMKVLPGINENLISYEYKVDGPWKDPSITVVSFEEEVASDTTEELLNQE